MLWLSVFIMSVFYIYYASCYVQVVAKFVIAFAYQIGCCVRLQIVFHMYMQTMLLFLCRLNIIIYIMFFQRIE